MAIDLTGRLLCACSQAYSILTTGPGPMPQPRAGYVGWSQPPQAFATGDDKIDAVLVGETANEIIVAFRGTLPFDSPNQRQMIMDWLDDLDCPLVADPGLPGLVHQGFSVCVNLLWPQVKPLVAAALAVSPQRPIYITGHSKGGAVAFLAGWLCRQAFPAAAVHVCTFAAARCGDQAFADAYNAILPQTARYEYADDIVPHLPPDLAFAHMFADTPFLAARLALMSYNYVSAGDLFFINWTGQIVQDTGNPLLRFERFMHLATLIAEFKFAQIAGDHSINLGSGYATAICPGY